MSAVNVSKHVPSFDDLIWAGPRMMRRIGSLLASTDGTSELQPNVLSAATELENSLHAHQGRVTTSYMGSGPDTRSSTADITHAPAHSSSRFPTDGPRGLGSIFSYATSKWALCCVAMAIILNRAYIFAATRRRLALPWHVRLAIRGVPLLLLGIHARQLLQSLQCQTSAAFPELRWNDPTKKSELMFSHPNAFLHSLSSILLFGASDRDSCLAVKMIPKAIELHSSTQDLKGSLGLLWPLFGTFCLSQLVETIICAVEGRPLTAETSMTLFEHSLAFAEADAAISNQLGLGIFNAVDSEASADLHNAVPITRSLILSRVNTPSEVLLVALLSTMAHITSHILGVFNLQARFRLLSTTVWGLCFMTSIFWSAVTFSMEATESQSLLRYPTVCIIGFIPHVLVFSGIMICVSIYGFALALSALVPPSGHEHAYGTIRQRLSHAQANLQANISWSELRINREMEFYTALLRAGFGAISLASEAVYLNEDAKIANPGSTWLEEGHLQQLEGFRDHLFSQSEDRPMNRIPVPPQPYMGASCRTGFAHERPMPTARRRRPGADRIRGDGVGAAVRSARWLVAMDFVLNINRALFRFWAVAVIKCLGKLGVWRRPRWLLRMTHDPKTTANEVGCAVQGSSRDGVREDTSPTIPGFRVRGGDQLDVETELRAYLKLNRADPEPVDEETLDAQLYDWWLNGHAWGLVDGSGDYADSEDADDADKTSILSFDTSDNDPSEWVCEPDNSLPRLSPFPHRENSPIVDTPIQATDLARLLRPQNQEEQEEANALSAHLASDETLTRSRYQRVRRLQLARVLATGSRGSSFPNVALRPSKLTHHEEARLLEQILLSRRESRASQAHSQGIPEIGPEGSQCVVCQSAMRAIIVWPCRCLSLCDDCRVALAMNNFDRCVCCRREVDSFSRIYVP